MFGFQPFVRVNLAVVGCLAALALATMAGQVRASTYYVDAEAGSDSYDGLAAAPDRATGSGPWLTLTKVSAATLQPGDQVLLRCGQSWRQTLTLMQGGAAGRPITIGSNPSTCANKPAIDGGLNIPAEAWQRHRGSIYKVQLPFSVVPGLAVNVSAASWRAISARGDATVAFRSSCTTASTSGCTAITAPSVSASLSSYAFSLKAGQSYTLRVQILAPRGSRYGAVIRSDSSPASPLTAYLRGAANGDWQDLTLSFTPTASHPAARLDIDVPGANSTTLVRLAKVEQDLHNNFKVLDAVGSRTELRMAHHPNIGFDASNPSSPYLKAGISGYVLKPNGQLGSDYVVTGSDLVLPAGASLAPGIDVWIRSQAWSVKSHKVTAVISNRLSISPASEFPLAYPGWGYFLTGALWMLDSPGEWFYDSANKTAYVWMADSAAPRNRVTLTSLDNGVVIGSPTLGLFPRFISFNNLNVTNVGTGFEADRMSDISLTAVDLLNLSGFGVKADGAARLRIESSNFTNTLSDAVFATGASDSVVLNNTILNSGVKLDAFGKPNSLPRENYGALLLGSGSNISGNTITNMGYYGIFVGSNSNVSNNVVNNYGLVLNDGGGIYAAGTSGATVRNNMVLKGVGNSDGLPPVLSSLMGAIYLDGNTSDHVVQNNTFSDADYCLLFHNSARNLLEGNTCYGARRSVVRMHESARANNASGDTYGNRFLSNQFVHTTTGPAITLVSNVTGVEDFGAFDRNIYSTLRSSVVAQESAPKGYSGSYSLSDWQSEGARTGRTLEPNGYIAAPLRRYTRGTLDANLLTPAQTLEWSYSGGGTPGPLVTVGNSCGPTGQSCVVFNAGGGMSRLTGPRFPLAKGKTYRISFDAKVSDAAQALSIIVLRAGPTYESLAGVEPFVFSGSTVWRRYSFTFVATDNATAARMDMFDIAANRQLQVANFEVVPYATSGVESATAILINPEQVTRSFACPTSSTQAAACGKFFTFADGQRINWPVTVGPRSSLVVFSQDDSLLDTDGDGVADAQDKCPNTLAGAEVNANGCALGQ